jgi:hypothetical protein
VADLAVREIPLDEESEARLLRVVEKSVRDAVEAHHEREELYVSWDRAYKAKPRDVVKNFPWPNSSNVVIPLIGMMCDAIVARLLRAMVGAKDFCEVEIKSKVWEVLELPPAPPTPENPTPGPQKISMEKEIRDWLGFFITTSGSKDRLRTLLADVTKNGDGFFKPRWVSEQRTYHTYSGGQVVDAPVPEYQGVRWDVPAPADIIPPRGFDEWFQLPFVIHRLRYTWEELISLKGVEGYRNIDETGTEFLKKQGRSLKEKDGKQRNDPRHVAATETASLGDIGPAEIFTVFEINGKWPITGKAKDESGAETETLQFEECILTFSLEHRLFIRTIYNPFFGKARFLIRAPFLVVPHELYGQGVAEQAFQFQEEATTAHNQVVDAGTLANAPLVVVSPDADLGNEQEIRPGKKIVTDKPREDINVVHLGANSSILGSYEEKAVRYAEARVGVSPYHLGMESTVVGSRATATGTTALIGEGNLRFAMSIDDIRRAIEEGLYLTIQLEQQMRPEGYEWAPGRFIQFPQGDVRTSIGLQLSLTSEKVNRDIEIQNLMLLMQILNEYYMRLMQAAAIISNPMFAPAHKAVIMQVMDSSQQIIRRFVERFEIEDIDSIVPGLMETVNAALNVVNTIPGLPTGPPALPPGGGGPSAGSGGAPPAGPPPQGPGPA